MIFKRVRSLSLSSCISCSRVLIEKGTIFFEEQGDRSWCLIEGRIGRL